MTHLDYDFTDRYLLNPLFTGIAGFEPDIVITGKKDGVISSQAEMLMKPRPEKPYLLKKEYRHNSAVLCSGGPFYQHRFSCRSLAVFPVFDYPPDEMDRVLFKIYEKWRDSNFNIGVAIGEGASSARMMLDRLRSIARVASAIKNRDLSSLRRPLRGYGGNTIFVHRYFKQAHLNKAELAARSGRLRDAYLELKYGWSPLLSDIFGAAHVIRWKPSRIRIRVGHHQKGRVRLPTDDGWTTMARSSFTQDTYARMVVKHSPSTPERLGLTDPASIAWNLVPWSFVYDWFVPVSSSLGALHAKDVLRELSISLATTKVQRASWKSDPINATGTAYGDVVSDGIWGSSFFMERIPNLDVETVKVNTSLRFKLDHLPQKIFDTSVLVSTLLRGFRR